MKAKEIQDLIDFIAKSGLDEVNIETQEFKIEVKKSSTAVVRETAQVVHTPVFQSTPHMQQTAPSQAAEPKAISQTPEGENSKYVEIKSPMIGTFYRSANPDVPPFVQEGDTVKVGQTVCIVEAMKLFNEIESEVSGKVVKVLIDNASPVEFDQPLFLIDPA